MHIQPHTPSNRRQPKSTVLIAGATGNTGRLLVERLLDQGHSVRAIVREASRLPTRAQRHPNLTVIEASILDLSDAQLAEAAWGCDAVVSCLGHVLSFEGVFMEPRRLCTDATRRLCQAIEANRPAKPVRFVLMNTVGVPNPDLEEQRTWYERGTLALLRWLIPPHRDNEEAAAHLHGAVGTDHGYVQWCSVRPDALIDGEVSDYEIESSPVTGIFTGRPTRRANVAHFMSRLIEDDRLWSQWRFKMPVVMNRAEAIAPRA